MQEKKLYIIAMIGALICFTGDILLGFFTPAPDFRISKKEKWFLFLLPGWMIRRTY